MKTNHLPWKLRNTDFFQPGWHTEPTAAYQLMIEFLRLSPSYELARLSRLGKLSNDQIKKLPRDFKQVLAVYDLIGDINYMLFREWWLINGLRVFGVPFTKQDVHEIAFIDSNNDFDFTNLNLKIESKIREIRKLEGTRPTVWGCTEFCVNGLMTGNRRISRSGYDLKHKESSAQRSH